MREPVCLGCLAWVSHLNLWGHCFSPNLVISGLASDWRRQFGNIYSVLFCHSDKLHVSSYFLRKPHILLNLCHSETIKTKLACACVERNVRKAILHQFLRITSLLSRLKDKLLIHSPDDGGCFYSWDLSSSHVSRGFLSFSCVMHWGW